jgi:hypothetical protein
MGLLTIDPVVADKARECLRGQSTLWFVALHEIDAKVMVLRCLPSEQFTL